MEPMSFSSIVVASSDDRYVSPQAARRFARSWGSQFVLLSDAGHINAAAGFGPWDEGLELLKSLRLSC
jgi:predicted alpha/beta hydrolase family esterase